MKLLIHILLLITSVGYLFGEEDLYRVLGVKRTASSSEIKRAYKNMAREWHPDKNDAPEANEKFMKINEAYTTLSDEEKRKEYDNFGTTSASMGQNRQHHGGFDSFFSHGFGGFNFNFRNDDSSEKHRITLRAYQTKILPESKEKPYLIYAYADFCLQCMQIQPVWTRIAHDLETIGMGIGRVHVQMDNALTHKLGIQSIPSIVGVVNGRVKGYHGEVSVQKIRQFIRSFFPSDLVTEITDRNYKEFLNGWKDNRVRCLFFADRPEPTLRYVLSAFAYKDRVAAGYVHVSNMAAWEVKKQFGIGSSSSESILMFNEEQSKPAATLNTKQAPRSTIDEMMESNKYLILPRLSSQQIFNDLCPQQSSSSRKSVCVVMLVRNEPKYDPHLESFRSYAQQHYDMQERVKYVYVFEEIQASFVRSLTKGEGKSNETNVKVALLWRKNNFKLQYDWLDGGWPLDKAELPESRVKLRQLVDWAMKNSKSLSYTTQLSSELANEHAPPLMQRMMLKLLDWYERGYEKLAGVDEVTLLTFGMTIGLVFVIGFMMKSVMVFEDLPQEQRKKKEDAYSSFKEPREQKVQRPVVSMHVLNHETFNKLILHTPPGVRTVFVLVSEDTRTKLLQQFAHIVQPYARSDAFNFAYLQLEHHMSWYRHLLEETLDFKRDLGHINLRNCLGTVLAVNGPRKYYCIFHARHKWSKKGTDVAKGGFIGLDSSDSDEDSDWETMKDDSALFESDLLGGFSLWLDRLCEGSLQRFRVEYWPTMHVE